MIKRTGEIVLAIIGLVLSLLAQAFIAIIGLLMISGSKGKEGLTTFYNNYYKTMTEWEIPKKEVPDPDRVLDFVQTLSWTALTGGLITLALGIFGIYYILKNKKPVFAGYLFLAAGVVSLLSTALISFIPALLFIVAAILCFVRKPKSAFSGL
ncbi:DUF4064 domain-containing protein [Listeria monocytogenes]|uniref:DUF4064 domain-containing protein n=1 Tax=Listeria monocytogenes TaxID=1639 RepID=UPI00086E5338|nr:DUF4064 domain-containing protein [Listeria monocytogenes]ASH55326.1 hypothetical protein A413_0959 [Listeria monocytogenes serotype 1/2a str. 10-4754]ASH58177.1 hypothetical protein A414_0959 [Listeria monocytogenes serotype 1/2a str. 10-4758]EAC7977410.1 DUF4064 domain-containing protein [Listeria monocytogenes]EAE0610807.1 DUF4064 domain-containing protein [Listeria monocytogenes]EAG6731242.1 DUF4064 domain-containing protein [Listeria monocytogenes]